MLPDATYLRYTRVLQSRTANVLKPAVFISTEDPAAVQSFKTNLTDWAVKYTTVPRNNHNGQAVSFAVCIYKHLQSGTWCRLLFPDHWNPMIKATPTGVQTPHILALVCLEWAHESLPRAWGPGHQLHACRSHWVASLFGGCHSAIQASLFVVRKGPRGSIVEMKMLAPALVVLFAAICSSPYY